MRDELQRAYELVKNGERKQAVRVLAPVVKANPTSFEGWWLLANALDDPERVRKALQQALRLRPDHAGARRKLAELDTDPFNLIAEDPFAEIDADPFAPEESFRYVPPAAAPRTKVDNAMINRRWLYFLLVVLVLLGVAFLIYQNMVTQLHSGMQNLLNDFGGTFSMMRPYRPDVQPRADVNIGQPVQGAVYGDNLEAWTFYGVAGSWIDVYVFADEAGMTPFVQVYDPYGELVMFDGFEDIQEANAFELLDQTGTYTVVVQTFPDTPGGRYTLEVRLNADL